MNATGLFLPFTPAGKATELRAIEVKAHLGLPSRAIVDPFSVLPDVPAELRQLEAVASAETAGTMLARSDEWSGYAITVPATGEHIIVLNPAHSLERQRATLMEEIVHLVLDHPMSELSVSDSSAPRVNSRTHSSEIEDEAFCVGAACLIPYGLLFDAVKVRGEEVQSIAARFGVSAELVRYRIKRAGLTSIYKRRHSAL